MDNKNVNNKKDIEEIEKKLPVDEAIAQVSNCTHLNLRKTPDVEGDVTSVLTANAHIIVEREVNDIWTKVNVEDPTGFVMTKSGFVMTKYIEVV